MACLRGSSLERAPTAIEDAPAFAKDMEMALPMPLEAPEMKTLLPARFAFWGSMAGYESWCNGSAKELPCSEFR